MIVGPSGSGKTVLVEKLLAHLPSMFTERIQKVKYCYGVWQDRYEKMKKMGVEFHQGLPQVPLDHKSFFPKNKRPGLLILDDLMNDASNSSTVLDLFTKDSHHKNVVAILICQNMFPPGKFQRTINLNSHYVVAFKNPRDKIGVRTLAIQSFPGEHAQVLDVFREATERPHSYLLFDFHPSSKDEDRLKTNILPSEKPLIVYKREEVDDDEPQRKKRKT